MPILSLMFYPRYRFNILHTRILQAAELFTCKTVFAAPLPGKRFLKLYTIFILQFVKFNNTLEIF